MSTSTDRLTRLASEVVALADDSARLQIAHVLMMDIVGYSRLPMADQRVRIGQLSDLVRATAEFSRADAAGELISLPTGDGMALVFFDDPEAPIRCAIEVARAIAQGIEMPLRMGVHSGPVYRVTDINANLNASGGGVNLAQRVMDSGDAGHILVSSTATELLGQIRHWDLRSLGEHEVKHGLRMRLFNLCHEEVGNPDVPTKLATEAAAQAPPPEEATIPPTTTAVRPATPKVERARGKLALPGGWLWLGEEPGPDCPHDDPEAYPAWITRYGPVAIRNSQTGLELVWVPGGSFMMGSARGRNDEKPVRKTDVDGFWIGRAPVTVRQWQAVMGSVPPQYNDQGPSHPVAGVTWDEAREFCRRAAVTLLPETHWEYAARGREGRVYPWGSQWDPARCQSKDDLHGRERTAPVGGFPGNASWCGALDMAGNVWEWCRDWYHPNPQEGDPNAPTGRRSLRGGSWACDSFECRNSCRMSGAPNAHSPLIGLRIGRPKATVT